MELYYHNNIIYRWWRNIDQSLIIAILILFGFSLMLVTTSGPAVANRIGLNENYFAIRQLLYLSLAAILIVSFSFLDKKWLKRIAILGFLTSLLLLILTKFYGYEVKGAVRWINLLGFSMQPSEFIKPFFAIVSGWLLSLKFEFSEFPSFISCIILYTIIATLLLLQPDLGMLVMITIVLAAQFFIAGVSIVWIILVSITSSIGFSLAYFCFPHVQQRINNFLDPDNHENYQVAKSLSAFQHGGLYGRGPGEGSVKQFLPDSHTDFIFAVAGEEFGAIACMILVLVFAFIVIKSLIKLINNSDRFTQIAGCGIVTQFAFQTIINMGVTLNLLPTKGMTLPFISYGGSSTLAMGIATGMLLALTKNQTSLTALKYKIQNIEI